MDGHHLLPASPQPLFPSRCHISVSSCPSLLTEPSTVPVGLYHYSYDTLRLIIIIAIFKENVHTKGTFDAKTYLPSYVDGGTLQNFVVKMSMFDIKNYSD